MIRLSAPSNPLGASTYLTPREYAHHKQSYARVKASEYITCHAPTRVMLENAVALSASEARYTNTLILGPSGTGKELVAAILHSTKAPDGLDIRNFVAINCSGVTESLFESLVFGHSKGAYTGAVRDGLGLLREASSGTVFFDEVGDLPLPQQAKLLRVLQSREATPVGETKPYAVTCRFVFATHKSVKDMVYTGEFREDLYYRISTIVLRTLPLSARLDDVPLIASAIAAREKYDMDCLDDLPIQDLALARGNVRAIENFLARKVLLQYSNIEALDDL